MREREENVPKLNLRREKMYLVCFKWWLRLRLLNSDHATSLFVKCSLGSLKEIPEATRNPPVPPENSVFWCPLCGGKNESVWSLGNEGGCSWEVQVQGHLALRWLWSHSNMGQGWSPGKGSAFLVDDFLQGKQARPLSTVASHPPSLIPWCNWTGSEVIYRQPDHILFPSPLANMKKSFKDCG